MPHIDPTVTTIIWGTLILALFVSSCIKVRKVTIRRIRTGSNSEEAIRELDSLKEEIVQGNKSGNRVFMIMRKTAKTAIDRRKPIQIINKPEDEIRALDNLEDGIRQANRFGQNVNVTVQKTVRKFSPTDPNKGL
jgi:hypothetical protein